MKEKKFRIIGYYKGLVLTPSKIFAEIASEGQYKTEIVSIFILGAIVTFAKTFLYEGPIMNYYATQTVNDILTFIAAPRISWILTYVFHFLFLYVLYKCYAFKFKSVLNFGRVLFPMLAIGGIGLLFHLILLPFNADLPYSVKIIIRLFALIWVLALSFIALRVIYKTEYLKLISCFFIVSILFVLPMGFQVYSPSLNSITRGIW